VNCKDKNIFKNTVFKQSDCIRKLDIKYMVDDRLINLFKQNRKSIEELELHFIKGEMLVNILRIVEKANLKVNNTTFDELLKFNKIKYFQRLILYQVYDNDNLIKKYLKNVKISNFRIYN
jgi:hypothetical protein